MIFGVGPSYAPDYEGSDDYELGVCPLIVINYRDLILLRGPSLRANLLQLDGPLADDRIKARPLVEYVFGRDEDDNDALAELGDVDDSLEVGGFAGYEIGSWSTALSIVQDVAGGHEGLLTELEGGYDFGLMPRFEATVAPP